MMNLHLGSNKRVFVAVFLLLLAISSSAISQASYNLAFSTYFGGSNWEHVRGVCADTNGNVYICGGTASRDFPTTPGVFQPTFQGYNGGGYGGYQNAFAAKLSPDGSNLVWASYVGVAQLCRDIAIDARGDIYLPLGYPNQGTVPPSNWFTTAFQKTPKGGTDCGAIKVSSDGSNVLWATWLGGSGDDLNAASIRVGRDGKVYVASSTSSADFPTTPGAHDRTYNGGTDYFVACLTADGSDLVYATFLGGSGGEWLSTHNLAVDDQGNAYVALQTSSTDYPVTPGVLQRTHGGANTDRAITKLSPTGALLFSTYLGGSGTENADGIYVDSGGNVFVTGETSSDDFPVTSQAYQRTFGGNNDGVLVRLSADDFEFAVGTYY